MLHNRPLAEALGTFTLVFAGCGAVAVDQQLGGALGHVGVSLVFGLVVMAMIYAVGNVSGAHLNPAVTLGFHFAGRFDRKDVAPYVGAQCVGALLGAGVARLLIGDANTLGVTVPAIDLGRAFAFEVVLTFVLMFVILNVSTGHKEKGIMAGVAVGGTVALAALVGGPATGASMNPARTLGPALVTGEFHALWIYLVAPVVGAFLAHPTCRAIQGDACCGAEDGPGDPGDPGSSGGGC